MELARKRKHSSATPSTLEAPTKKFKLLNSNAPTQVQKNGWRLVGNLRKAVDKSHRPIADAFLELPPRDELPDYYEVIKLPVALETIQAKLDNNEYPTMTTLESDFKRMVQNAKDYNMAGSAVYEDAERIRKLVYNFMKAENPAYNNPGYSSFATPIPVVAAPVTNGVHTNHKSERVTTSRDASERPAKRSAAATSEPPDRKSSAAPSYGTGDGYDETDFTGKSFGEAQQKIMMDLMRYEEDGLKIYLPFETLPSRSMDEYYSVIKEPMSTKAVWKKARGKRGRNPETGITDFKTWDAFEKDASLIWLNARHFNEDGSEMYELANTFEEHFKRLVAQAKEHVEQPGPRLKIGGPKPPVTLNLSQKKPSPGPSFGVDSAALQRQKQMVAAGVNGHQSAQTATNGMTRTTSQTSQSSAPRPGTAGSPPALSIKHEKGSTQSPALAAVQLASSTTTTNGPMPPPTVRPPSNSSFAPPPLPHVSSYHFTAPALLPPTQTRTYPIDQALLPNITIATHPQLKIPAPYRLNIPPHTTLSHQSSTITLPNSHYFLQISPTISKQLAMGRPYKLFVTVNGTRLSQRDTQFDADTGKRTHVYEGSLAQGVNRIEIEVAAAKEGSDKGLDVEKATVFANLMRA